VLEVIDLHVRYGAINALRGATLSVERGELVAVVGPNGAGKSTLLMTIAGAVSSARGEIRFLGREIGRSSPEERVRQGIALVPERRRIFTSLTVAENLRIGMSARRDRAGAIRQRDELLTMFPILGERYASPAGQLSGGEQQQLAIARSLLTKPELLLVDEPSLGLAPRLVAQVLGTLVELRDQGTTILLVEQNALKALAVANRAYVLNRGEIREHRATSESGTAASLFDTYFGLPASPRPEGQP
jgi:branched-chain amino acid transport system ATP-binding protein